MDLELLLIFLATIVQPGLTFPVGGFASKFPVGQSVTYSYVTETLLNEATVQKAKEHAYRDVGLKFGGEVTLTVVWNDNMHMLVKLAVSNPSAVLESVSRKDVQKELKALPKYPVYFHWSEGKVIAVYTVKEDSKLSVNLKKGIVSLFQLVNVNKEQEETDASGTCTCTYIVNGDQIRKTKSKCKTPDSNTFFKNVNPLLELSKQFSSETIYTTNKDEYVETARVSERLVSTVQLIPSMATEVTVTQELKLKSTSTSNSKAKGANIESAIKKLSKSEGKLDQGVLSTVFESSKCGPEKCPSAHDVIKKNERYFEKESLAKVESAYGFLELVEALRDTPLPEMKKLIRQYNGTDVEAMLVDAITAAQTEDGQKVLMDTLKFNIPEEIDLPERYLLAVAFSTHPPQLVLKQLLALYQKNVEDDKLRESIGEALTAVTNTYCKMGHCQTQIVKDIQKAIVDKLKKCEDASCKCMNIRALSNAGIPETIPLMLSYATDSKEGTVNEQAVRALRRMGNERLANPEVRNIMKDIFHQTKRGYDTAVRSLALTYILDSAPSEGEIRDILLASQDPWNTDYNMYIQARLYNTMQFDNKIKKSVIKILKEKEFKNWDVMAPKGKSLAFTGLLGAMSKSTAEYFMYVENSRTGIMKRSGMDVNVDSPQQSLPVYKFGIFAAGLESLLGEEVDESESEIEATAGIALDLIGVSLRPITFFEGSSGLMSAVWSAPSEPTSALQANVLLQDHSERLHLQNGLIIELDVSGAVSMDLSGALDLSLWNKNAHALISNSASYAVRGSARLVTSSYRTGLNYRADATSVINFQADVDFYDGIKMCLQMFRPDIQFRHEVEKFEYARGFKKGYNARIRRKNKVQAVSYPLPPANNKQCRALKQLQEEQDY